MCECERRCFQMQAEWSTWNLQYVSLLKCTAHNRSVGCGSVCRLILTEMGERKKKCSVFAPDKHRKKTKLYKDIVIIFVYLFWGRQQQCSANCLTTVHSVSLHIEKTPEYDATGRPRVVVFFVCLFCFSFLWQKKMCVFHENADAVRLADLVYSPRACLWEHHVYCAVSSTSMECNICHGCHSQWRCHFGSLPAE